MVFGGENSMKYMKKGYVVGQDFQVRNGNKMVEEDYFYDNMYFEVAGGYTAVVGYLGLHMVKEGKFVSVDPSKGTKYIEDN